MKLAEITAPNIPATHNGSGLTVEAEAKRAALRLQSVELNALIAAKASIALDGIAAHLRAVHKTMPHSEGLRGANTAARHQAEALRAELLKALARIGVEE